MSLSSRKRRGYSTCIASASSEKEERNHRVHRLGKGSTAEAHRAPWKQQRMRKGHSFISCPHRYLCSCGLLPMLRPVEYVRVMWKKEYFCWFINPSQRKQKWVIFVNLSKKQSRVLSQFFNRSISTSGTCTFTNGSGWIVAIYQRRNGWHQQSACSEKGHGKLEGMLLDLRSV